MKIQAIILSTAVVFSSSGCEQKAAQTEKSSAAESAITQKIQEPAEQTKQVKKTNPEPLQSAQTLPVAAKNSSKVAPTIAPQTTEQSLAEVSNYARDVTKTKESKTRNRAQEAEEEMLHELEQHKKP